MCRNSPRAELIEQFAFEILEGAHDPDHFEGGAGGFDSAVVVLAEAADAGLFFVLEKEYAVDHGLAGMDLETGQ